LGILDYQGSPQLLLVKEASLAATTIEGKKIFVIEEVQSIDIKEGTNNKSLSDTMNKLLSKNFYFSFTVNITQRMTASREKKEFNHMTYWWGANLLSKFAPSVKKKWNVFLVAGYFAQFEVTVKTKKVNFIIGARKSTHEGMVYPHSFGANVFGECANYITYEVILSHELNRICYTYSSATPPIDIQLTLANELIPNCCETKLSRITEAFLKWVTTNPEGLNCWILLRSAKDPEFARFNEMIDKIVAQSKSPNLKIWDLDPSVIPNPASSANFAGGELQFGMLDVISKQEPVDLTKFPDGFLSTKTAMKGHLHYSVFSLQQSGYMIHLTTLFTLITRLPGFESIEPKDVNMHALLNSSIQLEHHIFDLYDRGRAKMIRPSDMTKRFDLPVVSKSRNSNTFFASSCLKACVTLNYDTQRKVYAKAQEGMYNLCKAKISVISWNVAGYSPTTAEEIKGLLECFDKDDMPDIIALGLQEVVELKSSNIATFFASNTKENDCWVKCITDVIKNFDDQYVVMGYQRMIGLFSITLVHKRFMKNVFNLGIREVKTGFMGIVGNKGSVITSLMVGDSLVHFCNTHLPSGDCVSKRSNCVEDLYNEFCNEGKCDAFFLFGDLNMRVQMDLICYQNMMDDYKITNPKIDFAAMMEKDEVKLELHPCLTQNFQEADLPKAPTYRFVKNTNVYSDERVASW
jgi:hypothetical protein